MEYYLFAFIPSGMELIIILFAVLLFFGGRKIPELMRGIGKGVKEFNDASNGIKGALNDGMREADQLKEERLRKERERAAIDREENL